MDRSPWALSWIASLNPFEWFSKVMYFALSQASDTTANPCPVDHWRKVSTVCWF